MSCFRNLRGFIERRQRYRRPSLKQQNWQFWGPPLFFYLLSETLNKNQRALLWLSTQFSSTESKQNPKYRRDGYFCVLIRTQAKILKSWYVRSVVDRSITRAFRQVKSYSAFADVFNVLFLLRYIVWCITLFKTCIKNKTNLCLINIWRFILFNIWPKNSNLSLGKGNNV